MFDIWYMKRLTIVSLFKMITQMFVIEGC